MNLKNVIIFGVFLLVSWLLMNFVIMDMDDSNVIIYFIMLPGLIFIFNFMMRKNLRFQPYFTSKYNFLTSKYHSFISSDLPKDLLYQKMKEVLENQNLKIVQTDDQKHEILATKSVSIWSWGENIYIDFSEEGERTQMNFTSTTVLGIVSWGLNEKNYHQLLSNFEESLII